MSKKKAPKGTPATPTATPAAAKAPPTATPYTKDGSYQVGQVIEHPTLGRGTVAEAHVPGKIAVTFVKSGRKVLTAGKATPATPAPAAPATPATPATPSTPATPKPPRPVRPANLPDHVTLSGNKKHQTNGPIGWGVVFRAAARAAYGDKGTEGDGVRLALEIGVKELAKRHNVEIPTVTTAEVLSGQLPLGTGK